MVYTDIAGGCCSDTNIYIIQSGVPFTISGQIVTISGQSVTISGNVVQISGQVVTAVLSGCICINSGTGVIIQSGAGVLTTQLSGTGVIIQSGAGVITQSGLGIIANISGQTVITSISGNIVQISGQTIIAKTSGEISRSLAPTLLRNGYSLIGTFSGGTIISSGIIIRVSIQNMPGNDIMWIGAPGVNSGAGYLLVAGNEKEINIDNLNKVHIYAQTSGEYICYLAEAE